MKGADYRLVKVLSRLAALVMSLVWGFFVSFNVVFSDIFGTSEMIWAVAFVFAAYLLLGLPFGLMDPTTGTKWTWWLAIPGVLFPLLMLFDNASRLIYTAAVILAAGGGTFLGAWSGAAIGAYAKRRRRRDPS